MYESCYEIFSGNENYFLLKRKGRKEGKGGGRRKRRRKEKGRKGKKWVVFVFF